MTTSTAPRQTASGDALPLHAVTLIAFLAASSVPTPLYPLYQRAWEISPLLLTVIFAVYALGLLGSLLFFGSLSDRLGRRPVILAALVLGIGAMLLFLAAQSATWLIGARLLQGLATGLATASLGAALLDTDRERGALVNSIAPMSGMGVGALGSALLVQFAPAPLSLSFVLVLGAFLIQAVRTLRTGETATTLSPGAWTGRPRIYVPAAARIPLLRVTPINAAVWALGGFYLSLMPSLLRDITGPASSWMGGAAVAALTLSGAGAILIARRHPPRRVLGMGAATILTGVAFLLAGVHLSEPALLLLGSAVAGIGFGAGFLGALRSIVPFAAPHERAGLMAAFYIESYLSNAVPAMAAGYFATHIGLRETATAFGLTIIVVAVASLILLPTRRETEAAAETPAEGAPHTGATCMEHCQTEEISRCPAS